ncbi:hypothetical protein GCM10009111_25770 [Colwellia asteriadis]|uniref:Uncharacterized protein n=1 Tax=Colwellia asteriadis TaxID=517723 RepID=A0ABP3WJS9_9GAMM
MEDTTLVIILMLLLLAGIMYWSLTYFINGNNSVKPIVDNTILDSKNSKPRSFRLGKGMNKVESLAKLSFDQNNGQLFTNTEYLSMGAMNMAYIGKTSWSYILAILFFMGLYSMSTYIAQPNIYALYGGGGLCLLTGLGITYLIKLKYTESVYEFIRFERKTGLVIFPIGNGDKHFSVGIEDVELYTSKVSSGKGVMHRVAFLAPKKFPKTMWWQKIYTVSFMPRTPESAQILWTEVNHYMDKTKPIPKGFYRNWQNLLEDRESTEEVKKETLTPELYAQAPFYDRKNGKYLDKEFW